MGTVRPGRWVRSRVAWRRWVDQNRYRLAAPAFRVAVFLRATVRFTDAFRPGARPSIGLPASIHACTRSSLMRRAVGMVALLRNAFFCSAFSPENSVLPFAAPTGAAKGKTLFSGLNAEQKNAFRRWANMPNARRISDERVQAWIDAGRPIDGRAPGRKASVKRTVARRKTATRKAGAAKR